MRMYFIRTNRENRQVNALRLEFVQFVHPQLVPLLQFSNPFTLLFFQYINFCQTFEQMRKKI